ncbi:MAG: arginyltransferase [Gemmataceae bacterium]
MKSLFCFTSRPEPCNYLPAETSRMKYEIFGEISTAEYFQRMNAGWRRFGFSLFTHDCPTCRKCQSIRVPVASFEPDRSQKRALKANRDVSLVIGSPTVDEARIALYDKFHRFQSEAIGWPEHRQENPVSYAESFVINPFPTQEWCYYLKDELIGVGYVDVLPDGLSAIYFFYDPDHRDRSLGTFNVMNVIRVARSLPREFVYLGYYVDGCRSLQYKAKFKPNQLLNNATGEWKSFLD